MVVFAATFAAAACNQSEFEDDWPDPDQPDGPGTEAWGEQDVSCDDTSDCAPNETCLDGVCQMARCDDGPYSSAAPLADLQYFFSDREIIAADTTAYSGSYWIDAYAPAGGGLAYPTGGGSFDAGATRVVDLAGGNVLGTRPHGYAVAIEGRAQIDVAAAGESATVTLGFVPVAIAAGDVDADGVDEVIALSANGRFSICRARERDCDSYEFQDGVEGIDATAGDIDGDAFVEPVFLIDVSGTTQIVAFNADADRTGQDQVVGGSVTTHYLSIDAGDVGGDGVAEVIALEDGGWLGVASDHLHLYSLAAGGASRTGEASVDADSRDVTAADLDMDGAAEVMVLRDTRTVDVYVASGTSLVKSYTGDLSVSSAPGLIDSVDFDGDSPAARLVAGPELVPGAIVPTMVLHFPPYSRTFSDGLPYLFVGDSEIQSETFIDSVSLRLGVDVGVEAGIAGIFKASLSAKLQRQLSVNVYQQTDYVVGTRFNIEPNPELHGTDYGVVAVSCGCFHAYTYELDDPTDKLGGGDGGKMVVIVPVGGRTTIWSSKRYNAMAEAVGGLPIIDVPYELGDPGSYADHPVRPDGSPVPESELIFSDVPAYLVSDVGKVGWWLSVAEREIREVLLSTELSVSSSVGVGGVKFGAELGAGWGKGYQIAVGQEALFGGAVPPMPDDPSTPEDEYASRAFSFSPYVYREHYTDAGGEDAAYYVLSFAVGM